MGPLEGVKIIELAGIGPAPQTLISITSTTPRNYKLKVNEEKSQVARSEHVTSGNNARTVSSMTTTVGNKINDLEFCYLKVASKSKVPSDSLFPLFALDLTRNS